MSKVIWRANRVISIETRRKDENRKENVYVLAQMINKAQLLVFNLFSTDNRWENIDLNEAPILFCTYVTRQFIACSNVYIQDIVPLKNYEPPKYQIDTLNPVARKVRLWEGTKDEKEIIILGEGGGRLIEGDINGPVIMPFIPFTDNETIDKIEENLGRLAPVTEQLDSGKDILDILKGALDGFEIEVLEDKTVGYKCPCSRERTEKALISLGTDELEKMAEELPEVEVKCSFCGESYRFSKDEIGKIINFLKNKKKS